MSPARNGRVFCLSLVYLLSISVLFAALTILQLSSYAQTSAMKRGRDWMDLKRYDEAISQFMEAIREEPKNVEARYLVARCYNLKNDPLSSLNWIRETLSVAPNHSAARSLRTAIQTEGISYLSSSDKRMQSLGLQIVEQVPSGAAIPALRSLMASSDQDLASPSEKLMLKIDARQARAVWISWLISSDLRLKETGAERLWSSERYAEAAPILRRKYEVVFIAAGDEFAAKQAAATLDQLGWAQAVDILSTPLRSGPKMPQALVAADIFAQKKERLAIPALMGAFRAGLPGKPPYEICGSPFPQLADALARIGATESVPLLKEALSNYLSGFSGGNPFLDDTCVSTYLNALSLLDGAAWNRFVWHEGGTGQPKMVVVELDRIKDGFPTGALSSDPPIDRTSPNAAKIRAWLQKVGPADVLSGGVHLDTVGDYVKIQSATEMRYYGETHESNGTVKGAYQLFLHATADPNEPWVVTDVQDRPCDRCGHTQEQRLISFEEPAAGSAAMTMKDYAAAGNAAMTMKDYAAAVTSFKAALASNPDDPITNYRLGQAYLAITPQQLMDALWYIAKAVTAKGATEAQSMKIKTYLRRLIVNYQGGRACDSLTDAELNELLQLAGSSAEGPGSYSLPGAADLAAAQKNGDCVVGH
jgi:tetratricopeptide (TPR) repeat protein